MLDEALLRPGRLEVQVEIGLPDEKGRHQIPKVRRRGVLQTADHCLREMSDQTNAGVLLLSPSLLTVVDCQTT